jgi:hypothetical protein
LGTDDIFKKRREARRQRKHGFKRPRANSFLIVTEGKKTEPLYFKGMQRLIEEKVGGMVNIVEIPIIDIWGKGCSTGKLLEATDEIVKTAKLIYQNIWVVFDKDDFDDFDQAVADGYEKGYKVAWSNQSFEYWLYLHFHYSDSALHRNEWNMKLDEIFNQYGLGEGKYQKNYEDIYDLVNVYDGVNTAIRNAKRRMACYKQGMDKPSEYDPGTTVYELVEDLKKYLDEE